MFWRDSWVLMKLPPESKVAGVCESPNGYLLSDTSPKQSLFLAPSFFPQISESRFDGSALEPRLRVAETLQMSPTICLPRPGGLEKWVPLPQVLKRKVCLGSNSPATRRIAVVSAVSPPSRSSSPRVTQSVSVVIHDSALQYSRCE